MYKVLLADDELYDLEGMRRFIPWDSLHMEVVALANNGFAAMEHLEKHPIDILVTDIRMPNMSGLELAGKALERYPGIKIVFVSGYEDFHYAKQALHLNASGYVLKPVEDEELTEALRQVKAELEQEWERAKIESSYKRSVSLFKNEWLQQWLEGAITRDSILSIMTEQNLSFDGSPLRVAIVEIDDLSWKINRMDEPQRTELLSSVYKTVHRHCRALRIEAVCKLSEHRLALIVEWHRADYEAGFRQLIEEVKSTFPLTITVGIGEPAACWEEVTVSYRQAADALEYKMFGGKSKMIGISDVRSDHLQELKDWEPILSETFQAMSRFEYVRIYDELDHLFSYVKRAKSKLTIRNFSMHIISKLDSYLKSQGEDLFAILGIRLENLDILFEFETIDDIQSWLRKRLYEISEKLQIKKRRKNSKLMDAITAYANERLHENISLRDIGNHFSFSPNYLGVLFKEGTGQNFSDYLIRQRMEKAQKLLQNPRLKIFEVANSVGYRNLTYFSRQFRETYRMSPGEYRKQC